MMKYVNMGIDYYNTVFPSPYTQLVTLSIILLVSAFFLKLIWGKVVPGNNTIKACYDLLYLLFAAFILYGHDSDLDKIIQCLPFWSQMQGSSTIQAFIIEDFSYFVMDLYKFLLVTILAGIINVYIEPILKPMKLIRHFPSWFFWEIVTVVLGLVSCWGVDEFTHRHLTENLMIYVPVSLFLMIAVMVIIAFLKLVFRTAALLAKPGIEKMYTFFTQQTFGHAVSAAFGAVAILVPFLNYLEEHKVLVQLASGDVTIMHSLPALAAMILTGFLVSRYM